MARLKVWFLASLLLSSTLQSSFPSNEDFFESFLKLSDDELEAFLTEAKEAAKKSKISPDSVTAISYSPALMQEQEEEDEELEQDDESQERIDYWDTYFGFDEAQHYCQEISQNDFARDMANNVSEEIEAEEEATTHKVPFDEAPTHKKPTQMAPSHKKLPQMAPTHKFASKQRKIGRERITERTAEEEKQAELHQTLLAIFNAQSGLVSDIIPYGSVQVLNWPRGVPFLTPKQWRKAEMSLIEQALPFIRYQLEVVEMKPKRDLPAYLQLLQELQQAMNSIGFVSPYGSIDWRRLSVEAEGFPISCPYPHRWNGKDVVIIRSILADFVPRKRLELRKRGRQEIESPK